MSEPISNADPQPPPGHAAWRALLGAGDASVAPQPWLDLAVLQVGQALDDAASVRGGFIALRQEDGAKYVRAASFGEGAVSFLLAKAAERCLQLQRTVVQNDEAAAESCVLALPILDAGGLQGVVAIEIARVTAPQLDRVTRLLQWGLGWFNRGAASTGPAPEGADWLGPLSGAGDTQVVLEALCTQLAGLWGLMRLSVGLGDVGKMRVRATSRGRLSTLQTDFTVALKAAMEEAVEAGAPLAAPPGEAQMSAIGAHQRLLRAHEAAWALTLPIPLARPEDGVAWFAMTLEGEGAPPEPERIAAWQGIAARIAPVVLVRLRADRSLLGHAGAVLRPSAVRTAWKPALIVASLAALIGAAAFPVPYRATARATLEGTVKRVIAAPFDGYLMQADLRPGDRVTAGTLLARMDDRELRIQRSELEARMGESRRQADEAIGRRDMAAAGIAQARRQQAEAELRLIEAHLARTSFVAPFDAIVISGDPSQAIGAPVRRGDVIYELSPLEAYRVALEVEEGDFAAIATGQQGRIVLASLPHQSWGIEVTRVTPIATARDGRTTFRVDARLTEMSDVLRPGMQGVAKVRAGYAPLAWVWTRSMINWLRIKVWTWMP
ncbi:MAG: HlyD family efflux transporter periplasmic adaptor subunit [Roseococcus sp.]